MELRLLVLRTPDMLQLSNFYTLLGLKFEYHQHGNSPFHYSIQNFQFKPESLNNFDIKTGQ